MPVAQGGVPAAHPVAVHFSAPSQNKPLSQRESFGVNWQVSLVSLHVSVVQATPSLHGAVPATQTLPTHASAPLQKRPSLHCASVRHWTHLSFDSSQTLVH